MHLLLTLQSGRGAVWRPVKKTGRKIKKGCIPPAWGMQSFKEYTEEGLRRLRLSRLEREKSSRPEVTVRHTKKPAIHDSFIMIPSKAGEFSCARDYAAKAAQSSLFFCRFIAG